MPFRRSYDQSPYEPRGHRHNSLDSNETPMYVRPYLEDPLFLEPHDEIAHLEEHHVSEHHFDGHHVDGHHVDGNHDDEHYVEHHAEEAHHEAASNETPMYVRPYLEDPVFLQPDDGEVELLHPKIASEEDAKHTAAAADEKAEHHLLHDLPGDPDLENPD